MTAIPMHGAAIKIDVTVGATALTDISAGIRTAVLNLTENASQFHTIDSRAPKATEGGYLWSLALGVLTDTGATSTYKYLADLALTTGEISVEAYAPNSGTGSIKYAGEAVVQNGNNAINADGGSGNPMITNFDLLGAGALTKSVAA